MDIVCRKLDCKHNNKLACEAKERAKKTMEELKRNG